MKEFHFEVDELILQGKMFFPARQPKGKLPAVLLVHGWNGSERGYIPVARQLAALGMVAMTVNLRGHGRSQGSKETCSRQNHLRDLKAAYDLLAAHPRVDPKRIGAHGASYACHLLSLLSVERDLRWLALRAPATYEDRLFDAPVVTIVDERLKRYRLRKVTPRSNRGLRALSRFTGDLLIISGGRDTTVPPQTVANNLAAARSAASVVHRHYKRADHVLSRPSQGRQATGALIKWFQERLKSKG